MNKEGWRTHKRIYAIILVLEEATEVSDHAPMLLKELPVALLCTPRSGEQLLTAFDFIWVIFECFGSFKKLAT